MPDEETQPDLTATPVDAVPSDYREYERWRKAGGNTAIGPATPAGDQPPDAETAPVPEPEQPPDTEEEPAAPDEDETAPAATRPGRKERLIERQAREIEELRQQLAQQQPKPPPEPLAEKPADAKPNIRDFDTLEAYQEALTDWKITQRERERAEADARQQIESGWKSRQDEARTLYPDYDEAINSARMPDTPNQGVLRMALLEDPHGPKVAYWLAQHPDDVTRIAGLSPVGAIREIGRISAIFDQNSSAKENPKPKTSSAPPPPPAITRPSKTGSDSIHDARVAQDFRKWAKAREAQLKDK